MVPACMLSALWCVLKATEKLFSIEVVVLIAGCWLAGWDAHARLLVWKRRYERMHLLRPVWFTSSPSFWVDVIL